MKKCILLLVTICSIVQLRAQVFFGPENPISTPSVAKPESFDATDLDSDGDLDALIVSRGTRSVGWLENLDGLGNFGPVNFLADGLHQASNSIGVDVDGDGDNDVVCAVWGNYALFWLENLDGLGTFGERQMIDDYAEGIWRVRNADLDGDGDQDLLSAEREGGKFVWYENLDGLGNFSDKKLIKDELSNARDVYPVDIDNDGDLDVVTCDWFTEIISWHENTDGKGNFSDNMLIYDQADDIDVLFCEDFDGDGFVDILARDRTDVYWIKNLDGGENFSQPRNISNGETIVEYFPTDFDGDNDVDVLVVNTYSGHLGWFANNGLGIFGPLKIIPNDIGGADFIHAADLDGDNDQDYIATNWSKSWVYYHENEDGNGTTQEGKYISKPDMASPVDMVLSDINGDGEEEILLASESEHKIFYYEKTARNGAYGSIKDLWGFVLQPLSLFPADMDGDGDVDVLSASYNDGGFYWSRNNQNNYFSGPAWIGEAASGATSVTGADMDGDGDVDVLGTSLYANQLILIENEGAESFAEEKIISDQLGGAFDVITSDLDGDMDPDIVVASRYDDKISWLENTGNMTFGSENIVDNDMNGTRKVVSGDVDGDGDEDLIASTYRKLVWYENIDGRNEFSTGTEIINQNYSFETINDIKLNDIDNDGDLDIFVVSEDQQYVFWFANDGNASFTQQLDFGGNLNEPTSIGFEDVDEDGRTDVIIASKSDNKITWYRSEIYPVFMEQPQDVVFCQSGTANYSVSIDKVDSYQWQISWPYNTWFEDMEEGNGFSGTQTSNLTVDAPDTGLNQARFRCVITYLGQEFTSEPGLLTVDRLYEADAGDDLETCYPVINIFGSEPHQGIGEWTVVQGGGVFNNPSNSYVQVSDLPRGENIFKWSIVNGTCLSEDEVTVTKFDSVRVSTPADTIHVNDNEVAVFMVEATGNVLSYQWYRQGEGLLSDDAYISGSQSPVLTMDPVVFDVHTGNYYCVVIGECNTVQTPMIYLDILYVNTKEISPADMKLYPNPADGWITLESQFRVQECSILNAQGKRVLHRTNINENKVGLQIEDLPSGTYVLEVNLGNKLRWLPFIKQE